MSKVVTLPPPSSVEMTAVPVLAGVHEYQTPLSTLNGPGSPGSASEHTVKSKSLKPAPGLAGRFSGDAKSLLFTLRVAASSTLIRGRDTPSWVMVVPVADRSAAAALIVCGTPLPSTHSRSSGIAPTACGVAMDVPDLFPCAVVPLVTGASMLTPGAHQSVIALLLLNPAGTSASSVAATVKVLGRQPG